MKVLILGSKDLPPFSGSKDVGGVEILVWNLINALTNCTFFAICRKYKNQKRIEKTKNCLIYRIPFLRTRLLKTPSFNFLGIPQAIWLILKEKIRLLHAHEPVASFVGVLLKKLTKRKLIVTFHGAGSFQPEWKGVSKFFLELFEKIGYKFADAVVFVSRDIKNLFQKKYGNRENVFWIPNPVPNLKLRKRIKHKVPIVGFIGRLTESKGVDILLEATKNIEKIDVWIVGDGPLREQLEKKYKKTAKFLGFVKSEEILPNIDIFVLPSRSEGFPISLLEAMYAEKVCIASSVGECKYLIRNWWNGILFQPENVDQLRRNLLKVIKNKKKWAKLQKNAKRTAEKFTIERTCNAYQKLYKMF